MMFGTVRLCSKLQLDTSLATREKYGLGSVGFCSKCEISHGRHCKLCFHSSLEYDLS